MVDLLSILLIWIVSIVISIVSIIQTRGRDWYLPTTNKQKMIMTIINTSILFMVVMFMHEAIFINIKRTLVISFVIVIIIFFFASAFISKKVAYLFYKLRERKVAGLKDVDNEIGSEQDNENSFTIKEYIQKLLTVFNCVFFSLNVINVFVVMETKSISSYIDVIIEESQVVAYITIFWLTLVGIVITFKDWNYSDIASFVQSKKVKKDANYYTKKIVSRNR